MVYDEQKTLKWMIWGSPHVWKPSYIQYMYIIYLYILISGTPTIKKNGDGSEPHHPFSSLWQWVFFRPSQDSFGVWK